MGTIIKFVINMEGLDADLDQIQNRLAFTPPSPPRHAADPVVFGHLLLLLPPPTAAPSLSLFYMRHRRRRTVAVESGAPAGVP